MEVDANDDKEEEDEDAKKEEKSDDDPEDGVSCINIQCNCGRMSVAIVSKVIGTISFLMLHMSEVYKTSLFEHLCSNKWYITSHLSCCIIACINLTCSYAALPVFFLL
jgi:hypothetical protein